MINTTLKYFSHKVGLNFWHLEFATKYRYNMMRKFRHKNLVEAAIRKVATNHKIKIQTISVMPNHIHLIVTLPKVMNESKSLQLLKGRSVYIIFKNHDRFRLRYLKTISGQGVDVQSLWATMI